MAECDRIRPLLSMELAPLRAFGDVPNKKRRRTKTPGYTNRKTVQKQIRTNSGLELTINLLITGMFEGNEVLFEEH